MISPDDYNNINALADVRTMRQIIESTTTTSPHRMKIVELLKVWQRELHEDTCELIDESDVSRVSGVAGFHNYKMSRSTQQKREPISNRKYILTWGKHAGSSIEDILLDDPGWLVWAHEHTDLDLHYTLLEEAEAGPKHTFSDYADSRLAQSRREYLSDNYEDDRPD